MENTPEYYEMTREEQMKDNMRKCNLAYTYQKEKFFVKQDPTSLQW
jgi:acyl-CoA oxidase